MAAAAHDPVMAEEGGVPVSVATDYNEADQRMGNLGKGSRLPAKFKPHRKRTGGR